MKNTNQITDLTIPADALDFWMVADLINTLSGCTGADDAMAALEDWRDENAPAFAEKYALEGRTDDAETILGIYDGDLETDPDDPAYDPDSIWTAAAAAIEKANAPEEAAPIKAEEILRDEDPEYRIWDDALIWLDNSPKAYDGWAIAEEAARIQSIATHDDPDGHNLFTAGRIYGMATALAAAARIEGADADWWLGFIQDFAEANYDNGARIEE